MKHVLLSLALFISLACFSQISVISSNMMQVGDTVTRYVDTMTTQTAGPAGANQNWVMTTATAHQTLVTRAILPSATSYGSSFSTSNLAMTNDNLSYLFFNQNSTTSVVKGAAGDLLMTGCNIISPFVPDMLLHNFPRNYNDNFNDAYGMDVTIAGSCLNQPVDQVRFKRVSTIYDYTDGWGIVTTPVGKYKVLRIKRVEFSSDTSSYKLFSFSPWTVASTKIDTSYSYSWVSKEGKLAIAELANDTLDNPKKFTWSQIPPLSANVSSSAATCNGVCNGQATVAVSGLYTPYIYNWSSGETTATATGLCSGANTVTITDSIGNSKVITVSLTQSSAINVSFSAVDASCGLSNGSATVNASGGSSPYSYLWSGGQTTFQVSGLQAGTYPVTVTDSQGCSNTGNAIVNSSGGANVTVNTTDVSCFGGNNGAAAANAVGGTTPYTYSWSSVPPQTTQNATGLTAGNYMVTVNDFNGCSSFSSFTINEPAELIVSTSSTDASTSTSSDGEAAVSVSGGTSPYSYLWSNGQVSSTATGLSAANYLITVTDGAGCTINDSVTVGFIVGIGSQISDPKFQISVFPNPASEKIYFSGIMGNPGLTIFDISGKSVENSILGKNYFFVNVSNYKTGIYFYHLKNMDGLLIGKGKFAVER